MRSVLPPRFSQLWLGPSVLPEVQAASGVKWGGAYGDQTNPLVSQIARRASSAATLRAT